MVSTEKIGKLRYKIALITILATLALSVLVLADVIYYYRDIITTTASKSPTSFFRDRVTTRHPTSQPHQ